MKFKKLSAVFLSVIMLVAFSIPLSAANTQGENPDPGPSVEYDPKPYIYSIDTTVFQAGDIIAVPIKLSTMEGYASDVRMKLTGPEGKESMFSFYDSTGWIKVGDMSGDKDIKPYIQVGPSVPDGTYPITVTFSYMANGKLNTTTDKINLIVQGKSTNVLYVKSANFAQAQIGKENKSNLVVNIMNPTVSSINDIKVSFNTAGSKGFTLYENVRSVTIPTITSQGSIGATFGVYVDSTVGTGNHPITIDMSYKDATGTVIASSEIIYVQVTRTADAGTDGKGSTARVIVSGYKTDVEEIKAGKEFTLEFTLKNTSDAAVNNMKVVVSSPTTSGSGANSSSSAVFFPSEGSNSFYIPKITSQGTVTNTIKLMAKQDIEPGVYPVLLKLDYEDDKATAVSTEEQISFSVTQEQRLDVQAMTVPTDTMMGMPIPINFQYINKGKATIYNLSVSVEGDFTLEGGSQYIGNLTAGYNDYFDNTIMPSKEGSLKGEIVLKFENSNGEEQEQRTPITCNVSPMLEGDINIPGMGGGIEPIPQEAKGGILSKVLWIGIPTLVVVVGVLAFLIIMKKRKAKKVLVEDEED
ncbi:MAG: hypothetical protein RR444_00165 [Oscillospiraceae bacterium]